VDRTDPVSGSRQIRFEELGEQWLQLHNASLKPSSADRNRRCLKELLRFFNGSRVMDIRRTDCQAWEVNQAVSRNKERFPGNFSFVLNREELMNLKSQNVISKGGRGGRRKPPRAFTEHGALMASTVLRSKEAVAMSVYIIEAFVKMREEMTANRENLKRLAEIDKSLIQDDTALFDIYNKLLPLLEPPIEEGEKRKMGFPAD